MEDKTMNKVTCPCCKGSGKSLCFHNTGIDSSKHYATNDDCSFCSGVGLVDDDDRNQKMAKKMQAGNSFLRKLLDDTWPPAAS